jgi:Calx-beta domain/PQQ-like domain
MGRGVTRVTLALTMALLAGTGTAQAQNLLTIDDARLVETSGGPWMAGILVKLPSAPTAPVSVNYTTIAGSATPGSDYTTTSGVLTFSTSESTKVINLQILGDTTPEWSPTLKQDEVFFIELSNPSANATIQKGRSTITLLDDDHPTVNERPGVQFLSAVSGSVSPHGPTNGQVKLQWRVPAAQAPPTNVVVRENVGPTCGFPPSTTAGSPVVSTGTPPGAGTVQTYTHSNLALDTLHCYSVFTTYAAGDTTEIAQIKAAPFYAGGPIVWRYHSGSVNVVPPTVGGDAIYTVDNLGVVHAMERGPLGGAWPTTPIAWNPVAVGAPTQNRSAAVPLNGGWRLFLGTDGGGVHAIDGRSGDVIWSRSTSFGTALPNIGGTQAQPAGLFKGFGGNNDMILVGTNNGGSNAFLALDPANGLTQGPDYTHAQMGSVFGMAVVDYPGNRVFFLTNASSATLYGLDLGPLGTPTLTLAAVTGGNPRPFTGSNGSAVLRNNRLVFGDATGQVLGVDLVLGTSYNNSTGDGLVKGFLWPDRRDDRLYFATDTRVHGWRDQGGSFMPLWSVPVASPSIVLQKPGSDYLYVGDGNGRLLQIDVVTQAQTPLLLEGSGVQIGAPSLDGGHSLIIVGSSTGTIHAVRVPF